MLKTYKIFLILFLSFSLFTTLYSSTVKLSGYIYDKTTGKPIPDANVQIKDTTLGTASQSNGYFFIRNLTPGNYTLLVKVIGYKLKEIDGINLENDKTIRIELEPEVIQLDPVIVSATLSGHRKSNISASAEVLTETELQEITATTAAEAVESVSGIYIKNYDGFAGVLSPSIRGSNTNQVVVLLDGVRLNTAQGGGVDLNTFPISGLGSIEIVRGGHSALLGSDAVGGAIHLFSRNLSFEKPLAFGIKNTLGSFGTGEVNLHAAQKVNNFSYFVNYNHRQSDGNFEFKTPDSNSKQTRQNNDYKGDNLLVRSTYAFDSGNFLQLFLFAEKAKKGIAGSVALNPWTGAPMTTPNARARDAQGIVSLLSENQITDKFHLKTNFAVYSKEFHYTNPDGWTPVDDKHTNQTIDFNFQGSYYLSQMLKIQAGLEQRLEKLKSTKFTADDRKVSGAFAQLEIHQALAPGSVKSHLAIIPAVRYDRYSDVGSQTSPKIGVLLSAGENFNISARANAGKSFRAPSFDDLYWPDDGFTRGNPDLKPETATSWDAGITVQRRGKSFWQLEITYFNQRVRDLIGWGPDASGVWQPFNTGKAKISGLETGIKLRPVADIFYIDIYHTYMKAIDETDGSATEGKWLIYRPKNKIDLLAGINFRGFSLNFNYRIVDKRYTSIDNSASLSKYNLLNGNIGYGFSLFNLQFDLKLMALNLLNKSIYLNEGYPLPGREFRFTLGIER